MKIGIISDIHIDHHGKVNPKWPDMILESIVKQCQDANVDLLINAGDVGEFDASAVHNILRQSVPDYISVDGNHDRYGRKWEALPIDIRTLPNGMKLLSGTLWTNFGYSPLCEFDSIRFIPDFTEIQGVTPTLMLNDFERHIRMIDDYKPDILVTHFATHDKATHPRFLNNVLNPYFVPAIGDLVERNNIAVSIFGHTHMPIDYLENGCRYINNALGYWRENMRYPYEYKVKLIEV